MFTTSLKHDTQELSDFEIKNVGMIGFKYRPEVGRYCVLSGCLLAMLVALVKIRHCSQDSVRRLAGVQMLSPVHSGWPSDTHILVMLQLREDVQEYTLVDIWTIVGLAHLIPEADRCWLVNSGIDLRTCNKIYWLYKREYVEYLQRRVSGPMASYMYIVLV